MFGLAKKANNGESIRNEVSSCLYDAFAADDGDLGSLDRWSQRRIIDENLAKVSLVLEADDPIEHCYQNLVREIDTEAEVGVYLVGPQAESAELRELVGDPGISCKLAKSMDRVAPVVFEDEVTHSNDDLDIVWVTIRARYDRASIDARVSEIIMSNLFEDAQQTAEMMHSLRSLLYAFHEDLVRRFCKLPAILNEHATRQLVLMISDLADRAGDYGDRVEEIMKRADTH